MVISYSSNTVILCMGNKHSRHVFLTCLSRDRHGVNQSRIYKSVLSCGKGVSGIILIFFLSYFFLSLEDLSWYVCSVLCAVACGVGDVCDRLPFLVVRQSR